MLQPVQVVDNDDTASVSSFQMVSACNEQQQEQEQQHDPEHHQELQLFEQELWTIQQLFEQELQQQQDAHEHQKQQQLQHQHHHQPDEEPDGKHDEELDREMPSLGAWQEDEELVIALQMSLRDIAEQAEPIADSSSIISSSSSSSTAAATANVDDPFGQFIPEYGSAASSSSAASAPQTLMLPRIRNQRKGPKQASKVPEQYVAMAKIDEIVGSHDQIHASEYIDLSGCTATIFTDKPTTTSIQPHRLLCPIHQLEHNSYCQACNNYQFMKEKQQWSMAMQHSIQDSYDTSSIIFIDQLPYCSSHVQDMKEWCGTCNKATALRDQMTQMA